MIYGAMKTTITTTVETADIEMSKKPAMMSLQQTRKRWLTEKILHSSQRWQVAAEGKQSCSVDIKEKDCS